MIDAKKPKCQTVNVMNIKLLAGLLQHMRSSLEKYACEFQNIQGVTLARLL